MSEMSENINQGTEGSMLRWSEELDEQERGRREKMICRVNELAHSGILNDMDCSMIYDIMLQAARRKQREVLEQYMIACINEI